MAKNVSEMSLSKKPLKLFLNQVNMKMLSYSSVVVILDSIDGLESVNDFVVHDSINTDGNWVLWNYFLLRNVKDFLSNVDLEK